MSVIEYVESEMTFLCDEDHTFFCEKYVNDSCIQNLKSVEFIVKNNEKIFLVEAKSTAPKPGNKDDFNKYIDDISNKAIDSFSLLLSTIVNRRSIDICQDILNADYSKISFYLVLIIKNHEKEWCPPVQSGLENNLRHFTVAWNWGTQPVLVLTEDMARKQRFLKSNDDTL